MKNSILFFAAIGMYFSSFTQIITDSAFIHNQILNGVQNSDFIFEGEVVDVQSYWNSNGDYIYSSATVEVFQTWKHSEIPFEENQLVEVITRGGTVGNTTLEISHQLGFSVGQKGLFMVDFASYPLNPNSTIDPSLHFQPHDGLYFDYDYSQHYVTTSFASINFDCIDFLYELIDTNYVVECMQIIPNGTLQTQTYNQIYSKLNSNSQAAAAGSGTVTYTFENPKTTSSGGKNYFEYDIYISTTSGPYFQQGLARIKYDTTAFQSNIVNSNKITVQRGALISSIVDYMPPSPKDVASNVVAIAFGVDTTLTSRATFTSPIQLAHVKMEIKDCQSTPNLSFESTSIMNFITLYNSSPFGGTNESHSSIDASDTENSALCQMVISGFSPTKVNGGTGDIVTISGSMFGSTKGTVQLRNTDVNGSPWVTLDSYDVTWTDTEIIIKVPSVVPLASPTPDKSVGTGKIKITNQSGTSKESSQVLEVYYSWNNSTLIGSEKFKIFLAGVDNVWDEDLRNQQLGYSFVLNPNIANNSNAYGCVIKAIKDWVCATEIRWQVDSNVSSLPSKRDTVSTIQFGTTGASHIQGETQVWNYNCGGPSSSTMSFATDVDIIISNRSTHPWMYDSTGQNQQNSGVYDFYSIILHELGHAHLMKHVNDPNDLMWSESKYHPTNNIPWTDRKTVFSWSNLDGGAQIVDESENADYTFCSIHEYPMIRLHKENCSVSMYNENDKKSNSSSLLVFPNPFTNQVTIEFNSISTLTCHIEIFSLNGQKHFKSTQNLVQDAKNKFLINTEFFPSGFYLGKVQLGEEQFNFKIVKP